LSAMRSSGAPDDASLPGGIRDGAASGSGARESAARSSGAPIRPARPPKGRLRAGLPLASYSALVYAFLYAPIAVLAVFSFNSGRQTAVWEGFTLEWYRRLLADPLLLAAVRNSLLVAAIATAVATVAGTATGFGLARYELRGRQATGTLLLLPLIVPEVVLGAALLTFFAALALRLSLATVVIAHVVFSVSYVAIVVRARLAGSDPALEEAARDLGAGPWETFRRVTLPLALPGIAAGALLAATLSLDDYVITSFVAGPGSTTLPLHIYSMLKVGVTPEVNAVSTLLLAVTVLLIVLAQRLLRRAA
jgi:spermidine/putrescine transport system permease protein